MDTKQIDNWIDDLPPIGAAPARRAFRITYHEGGRLVGMSPAIATMGEVAAALHIQRTHNPQPGEYRIYRVAQGGTTARAMGTTPAHYPQNRPVNCDLAIRRNLAARRGQIARFAHYVLNHVIPVDLESWNNTPPLDSVQVGNYWYYIADLEAAWTAYRETR